MGFCIYYYVNDDNFIIKYQKNKGYNMIDFGAIFSQIWFLIPILIFVTIIKVLFTKLGKKAKKERYKKLMQENKAKGNDYEVKTGKIYEYRGFKVEYNGLITNKRDGGIDLICRKDDEIKLLIQCKNYNEKKSIDHEMIKVFHSNATKYMDLNELDRSKVELKYIVPNINVFDNSALKVFKDKYYRCRYEVI